jgi:hypothetical protein
MHKHVHHVSEFCTETKKKLYSFSFFFFKKLQRDTVLIPQKRNKKDSLKYLEYQAIKFVQLVWENGIWTTKLWRSTIPKEYSRVVLQSCLISCLDAWDSPSRYPDLDCSLKKYIFYIAYKIIF